MASLPNPHPSPLGHHRAPEHQDGLLVLYSSLSIAILQMIVCICQRYFLILSSPLLPLLCLQVHSLHLCLQFPYQLYDLKLFYPTYGLSFCFLGDIVHSIKVFNFDEGQFI